MTQSKNKRSFDQLEKTPEFQEELLLLKAQTLIYQLLDHQGIDQAALARKLGQTEAHVSALLSGTRNMTLKTLARICYLLDSQVNLHAYPVTQPVESISVAMAGYNMRVVLPHRKPYKFSTDLVLSETQMAQKPTKYSARRLA